MVIPDRDEAASDARFSGTTTGRVQVGRYIVDVRSPGQTTLVARRTRTDPPPELAQSLAQDTQDAPPERGFADHANHVLDTAEAVTDTIERATGTVKALLEGRVPDLELISEDLADWFGLMERLHRSGRFGELIKLGRPLCRLLALTLRWAMLVETLRLVFHAATALADTPTTAWAQHELGTLHGSAGDVEGARRLLNQARRAREAIGDAQGLAATDHNLRVLSRRAAVPSSVSTFAGVGVVVLVVAVLVFAETVSGGSSRDLVGAPTTPSTHQTSVTTPSTPLTASTTPSTHQTSVTTPSTHQTSVTTPSTHQTSVTTPTTPHSSTTVASPPPSSTTSQSTSGQTESPGPSDPPDAVLKSTPTVTDPPPSSTSPPTSQPSFTPER